MRDARPLLAFAAILTAVTIPAHTVARDIFSARLTVGAFAASISASVAVSTDRLDCMVATFAAHAIAAIFAAVAITARRLYSRITTFAVGASATVLLLFASLAQFNKLDIGIRRNGDVLLASRGSR